VVITLGLGGALILRSNLRLTTPWPWANTEYALVTGLSLTVLFFALYLTQQQRRLSRLRQELIQAQATAEVRNERSYARLEALLNVSRTMASATDTRAVFDAIAEGCLATFRSDRVSLMLLDRQGAKLEVRSAAGNDDLARVIGATLRVGQGVAGWVAENRQPVVLGGEVNPGDYVGFRPQTRAPQAAMVVPIELRDELIGVLNVSSHAPDTRYTDEDLQAIMVFAENAGICCRHAEQAEWMRQTIRRLDAALSKTSGDAPGAWAA